MARLGIHRDFLREFSRLEPAVQDRVYEAFAKFEAATHAGAHLERIAGVRDARMRSIRIDQYWRGIVLAPESGDTYTLLRVLGHDEAYAWAKRRRVSVNAVTGTIEVRDVQAIEDTIGRAEPADAHAGALIGDVSDADLTRLGVDEQVRALARTLTDIGQLEAARPWLPEAQYDVLLGLAIGMSPEAVWDELAASQAVPGSYDTEDVTAAVERSSDQVVLVSGPDELIEVFTYPLAQWRVYLHPSQRRAAYRDYRGPAQVTGGPGTGKTVVSLHRAKHLAECATDDGRILLTTFTKTLAASLEEGLRVLTDDDEALLRRVEVTHIDRVANRVVSARHGRLPILTDTQQRERWRAVIDRLGVPFTEAFLANEWQHVVLAHDITDVSTYLAVRRSGRGRPLTTGQREQAWRAMEAFRQGLADDGAWTHETISVEAARILAAEVDKPYRHIIVDEAQDLSPARWRMLRAAVPHGPDDLFIAADTHQRIYDNRICLRDVGIEVAGRSTRLTINYRTSEEILAWSLRILRGETFADLDDRPDTLLGCRSQIHGSPPELYGAPTKQAELDHLVTTVRTWLDQGVAAPEIGIATRSNAVARDAESALRRAGIPTMPLAANRADDGVAIGTMHRMKGLEFRCVAVIGVTVDQVPPPSAITPEAEDPTAHAHDLQRERCLLLVACTRAREQLAVSWHGDPSTFLTRGSAG